MSEWNPAECVARGISYLQSTSSDLNKIDLGWLDMNNCFRCALGQIDGEFYHACDIRNLDYDDVEYGFQPPESEDVKESNRLYLILGNEWKKQLTALRESANEPIDAPAYVDSVDVTCNELCSV
jgi:hypothetical protein